MRTSLKLLAAAGAALLLSSCASPAADSPPDAPSLTAVNVLSPIGPGIPLAPYVVAQEDGLFTAEGIAVTLDIADGSGYVSQQLVSGNVDFGLLGAADAVIAFTKRDDIRILFCNQINNVYRIVATAESGVESVDDLRGKTIGYTEPGGGESQLVTAALAEAGLEVNTDVTLVPVGAAGPQSLAALQDGTIQAYSSNFADVGQLAAQGIDWVDITPAKYSAVPGGCFATTEEVLGTEEGKKSAIAITRGWVAGEYAAIEDPDGAFDTVCAAEPAVCENPTAARALFDEAMKLIAPSGDGRPGELDPAGWQTIVEMLQDSGTVTGDVDIATLIDSASTREVVAAAYAGR